MSAFLRALADGVTLTLKVQPKASRDAIEGVIIAAFLPTIGATLSIMRWRSTPVALLSACLVLSFSAPLRAAKGAVGATGAQVSHDTAAPSADEADAQKVYFDLPEILANLSDRGRRTPIVKLQIALELEKESDVDRAENALPRILNDFQSYIRECRSAELAGSLGISRLRENLLARVNVEMRPSRVDDLLFKEIIID